ncbi:34527_t:CDS:2, partial [Racocetra persica]
SVSRFVNRRFLKSINQLRLLNLLCFDISIIINNEIDDNEKYTDITNNTLVQINKIPSYSKILIHNQFQFNNNEEQILGNHKFLIECGKNNIVLIDDSTKNNIQVNELNDSRNEKEGINQELIKIEITNPRDQILPDYNKEVHTSVNFVSDESESNQVDQDNEISHKIKYLKDSVKCFKSKVQELKPGREKLEHNYRKMKELEDLVNGCTNVRTIRKSELDVELNNSINIVICKKYSSVSNYEEENAEVISIEYVESLYLAKEFGSLETKARIFTAQYWFDEEAPVDFPITHEKFFGTR